MQFWRVSCYSTMNQIGQWQVIRHVLVDGVIQPLDQVGGNPAPDILEMDQHLMGEKKLGALSGTNYS
jgi:hypothetical protein